MTGKLRTNAAAAHVAPLIVFMLLSMVPAFFRIENPALPWYRQGPEHWAYPLQVLICGALLWWWRGHYRLAPWRGLALAVVLGFVGIWCWLLPNMVFRIASIKEPLGDGWWIWLGVMNRPEGFNPTLLDAHPVGKAVSIFMRFARMVVIVPLVEELFWRGFLMRYVVAETRNASWQQVPFGTHHWLAYAITTAGVTFIHDSADWPAAFVWGSLMYLLAIRTKSLGACVLMHAVGNLILGIYVLQTRQWGFW